MRIVRLICLELFLFFSFSAFTNESRQANQCRYGTYGCNPCVNDVERSFRESPADKKHKHRFHFKLRERQALNKIRPGKNHIILDHIQGIARLSGVEQDNWIAMTRSSTHLGQSGIFIARFDGINSEGDSWKHSKRISDRTESFVYYPADPEINHAGGISTLGGMLFVAGECGSGAKCFGRINIYDARDPFHVKEVNRLVLDGSRGDLKDDQGNKIVSKAAAVSAARLSDGRWLMFIGGNHSSKSAWVFVSDSAEMTSNTNWTYIDYWHNRELAPGEPWHGWQNINLIRECGTHQLYLSAMGTLKNKHFLYHLNLDVPEPGQQTKLTFIAGRELEAGVLTSLRNGGSVHISPTGKIISYAVGRYGRTIDEFY